MKEWKWWHIVAMILELVGLASIVLTMATDLNDGLFLPVSLCCIGAGNILLLVMNIRQARKSGKQ